MLFSENEKYNIGKIDYLLKEGRISHEEKRNFTLLDATNFLNFNYLNKRSTTCPCCLKVVGPPLDRHLSKSLVFFLITLIQLYHIKNEPQHYDDVRTKLMNDYKFSGNDYSTLKVFGLIEPVKNMKAGHYLPTSLAYDFITGKVSLPKAYEESNGRLVKWSENKISITELIDDKELVHVQLNDGRVI